MSSGSECGARSVPSCGREVRGTLFPWACASSSFVMVAVSLP